MVWAAISGLSKYPPELLPERFRVCFPGKDHIPTKKLGLLPPPYACQSELLLEFVSVAGDREDHAAAHCQLDGHFQSLKIA